MTVVSHSLNAVGLIFLTHAIYSAYEHSLLPHPPPPPPTSALDPRLTLPNDIILETLLSVLLLCIGIVLSSPELKPIQWRVWAGKIEKEKAAPLNNLDNGLGGNPYLGLERRQGFLDVRGLRGEFAQWVKEGK